MNSKFNIGDKVDYVNDFGVVFKGRMITKVHNKESEFEYSITPDDAPWVLTPEKNLHITGTYNTESFDIKLNNGNIAKFSHYDDWYNKVFKIIDDDVPFNAVLLENRNILYSITGDFEEAGFPLLDKFQPNTK